MAPRPEAPPPDTSSRPRYIGEQVMEVLFSRAHQYRATVTQDSRGLFRVHRDRWCISDWEVAGAAYWAQDDRLATITDSVEAATRLAEESLIVTPDGYASRKL
jgi:hypothetical protein